MQQQKIDSNSKQIYATAKKKSATVKKSMQQLNLAVRDA